MKKLLLLFLVLLFAPPWATAQSTTVNLTAADASCTATDTGCLIVKIPQGVGGATLTISGTFSATVQFEGAGDGGATSATYQSVSSTPSGGGTAVTSATAAGIWQVNTAGYTNIRIRCSTFSSGPVVATITLSTASARSGGGGGGGVVSVTGTTNQIASTGGTTPVLSIPSAFTVPGTLSSAQNGALSAPAWTLSGAPATGGTGATNVPMYYLNCAGSSQPTTAWSTSGTIFGGNSCSGFNGNFLDFHDNGNNGCRIQVDHLGNTCVGGTLTFALNSSSLSWTGRSNLSSPADGVFRTMNAASTGFTRLSLGPDTTSFPGLCPSGTTVQIMVAGGCTTFAPVSAASFSNSGKLVISSTAPTVSSGFGTGASVTVNNGTSAFRINVGTSNTGNGVIGLPAATGWNCFATDITTTSTAVSQTKQTASTTTTATLQNYTDISGTGRVDSDVLAVSCFAY